MGDMTTYFLTEITIAAKALMPYIGLVDDLGVEISGGDPAYARKAVTWDDPDPNLNGIMTISSDYIFDVPGGGTKVGGWRAYTALTGGEVCGGKDFDLPVEFGGQGTYLLEQYQAAVKAI